MAGQANNLSRIVIGRIDEALEEALWLTSRRANCEAFVTVKFKIRDGLISHRIHTAQGDTIDIAAGRIADGQLILPEFDPEYEMAKNQTKLDLQERRDAA